MTEIHELKPHSENYFLMATLDSVSAGEPQEIENPLERIDLNEFLTNGSDGVFMIRANGDSMETEIKSGDWLIINRNLQARNGDKIIASVKGKFTAKVFRASPSLQLVASNGKYAPRQVTGKDDFEIFGVITHILRAVK